SGLSRAMRRARYSELLPVGLPFILSTVRLFIPVVLGSASGTAFSVNALGSLCSAVWREAHSLAAARGWRLFAAQPLTATRRAALLGTCARAAPLGAIRPR